MDPPALLEQFLNPLSKIAVRVQENEETELFVKQLVSCMNYKKQFQLTHYDHETVILVLRFPRGQFQIMQPSLDLARDLGYAIMEASDFIQQTKDILLQASELLELLPCRQ